MKHLRSHVVSVTLTVGDGSDSNRAGFPAHAGTFYDRVGVNARPSSGHAEVTNFEGALLGDEGVGRLDVKVNDTHTVNMMKAL